MWGRKGEKMTKRMTRREMLGMVGKAAVVGTVAVAASDIVGCFGGDFEDVGPELAGDGRNITVYQQTEERVGVIRIVPRERSGTGEAGSHSGPMVVEIAAYDSADQRPAGEWVFLVDGQTTNVGAYRFTLLSGQRVQWRWRPFTDGKEPEAQQMPGTEWEALRRIGARNYV